jgi:peptide/nickel transport system permease protein
VSRVLGYVLRRLTGLLGVLFVLSAVLYAVFFLMPGDPARLVCGRGCSAERLALVEHKLGLDRPAAEQYGLFLRGLVAGRDYSGGGQVDHCPAPCLGYSFETDQPVWSLILDRLPVTVSITLGAAILWMLLGVGAGVGAALHRGRWLDRVVGAGALVSVSMPVFIPGMLLLLLFSVTLQVLPFPTYVPLTEDPAGWAVNLVLPWTTLTVVLAGAYARLARASMIETLAEDYIRTARAHGLPERRIVGRRALRGALTPLVTLLGLDLGALLGGAVIVESLFSMPGLGQLLVGSVTGIDLPVVVGVTLFGGFFVIVANFAVDLLYAVVDPRVRRP